MDRSHTTRRSCSTPASCRPSRWNSAGLPPGARVRVLRRMADGQLRAGLVDLPAGWQVEAPLRASGVIQLFVLEGSLEANGMRLGPRGFIAVPKGARFPSLRSAGQSRIVLIRDAGAALQAAEPRDPQGHAAEVAPVVLANAMAIEPIVPVIAGRRLDGFERRVLWLDESNGADTRLLRIPAGFEGGGPGWHPVEEEIFLLEGDVAPDDSRLLAPGDYLWNPARSTGSTSTAATAACCSSGTTGCGATTATRAPPLRDRRAPGRRRRSVPAR